MRHLLSLLCVFALGACGSARDDSGSLVIAIDSSGAYPVVRSTGRVQEWKAELVATVGAFTDEGDAFGSVRSVLLDGRGTLYVVDPTYVQLSVFDSLGTLRGRWGRRGRGPGEYSQPYSAAMLHDSVAVLDPFGSQITVYGPDGRWVRKWHTANYSGQQPVRLYRSKPGGFWVNTVRVVPTGIQSVFILYESEGPTDTMLRFEPQMPPYRGVSCHVQGGISFYPVPFGPAAHVVPTHAGEQAVAVNSAYRIAFLGRARDTLRVIERTVEAAPIADFEWAREVEKFETWRSGLVRAQCTQESFDRPATRPVIEWMVVDDIGRLWVEVVTARGRMWDVFDGDGTYRATVTGLPSSNDVDPSIAAGRIALVVPDSNGVQRVQVYRIRPH